MSNKLIEILIYFKNNENILLEDWSYDIYLIFGKKYVIIN